MSWRVSLAVCSSAKTCWAELGGDCKASRLLCSSSCCGLCGDAGSRDINWEVEVECARLDDEEKGGVNEAMSLTTLEC